MRHTIAIEGFVAAALPVLAVGIFDRLFEREELLNYSNLMYGSLVRIASAKSIVLIPAMQL